MKQTAAILVGLLLLCGSLHAAEIASNGTGGGPWSEPSSWRGNVVPGAGDEVVIQKRDAIVFDRDDSGKTSCAKLILDPRGVLQFKTGAGKRICVVAGEVENHGIIKLDGTKSAKDLLELRLVGATAEQRTLKVGRGGGLLLYGGRDLPEDRRNVALTAPQPEGKDEVPATVEVDGGAGIDWQRARIAEFKLNARNLDNTGAKPHERCNVVDCTFSGHGRIACTGCDTPVLARNVFEYKGKQALQEAAVGLVDSPLAEIKGNHVRGGFRIGIAVYRETDCVLSGNTVEKCEMGVVGGGGIPNVMIKDLKIRGCANGLNLEGTPTGVLENVTIEGGTRGLFIQNAHLQLNNVHVKALEAKGVPLVWESGTLKLLGGNLTPAQIKLTPAPNLPADQPSRPVTAFQYLRVIVKDAPADALVEVRTNDPRLVADAADSNVRNSPAPLVKGQSPAAGKVNALVVKCWDLNRKSETVAGPEYVVKVLGPPAGGGARPVLKTVAYRPAVKPGAGAADTNPTLEIALK